MIILDLDGTLYPSDSSLYNSMSKKIKFWLLNSLPKDLQKDDLFFKKLKKKFPSILQAIDHYGLSISDWQTSVFSQINPIDHIEKDEKLIQILRVCACPIFVVTLSEKKYAKKVLASLGVLEYISDIYTPNTNWHTLKKIDVYEQLRAQFNLKPPEVIVVGDNLYVDLFDAYDLGYRTVLISNKPSIEHFSISNIKFLKSTDAYKDICLNKKKD